MGGIKGVGSALKGKEGLLGADTGSRWLPVSLTGIRENGRESGLLGEL